MSKQRFFPTKAPKNDKQVESYFVELALVIAKHLNISGYKIFVYMPKDEGWHDGSDDDAGITVRVEYPYKSIKISLQKDTVEKAKKCAVPSGFWSNSVHGMIHEMTHVMLWNLMAVARARCITKRELDDLEETTVDHIANLLHSLLRDGE